MPRTYIPEREDICWLDLEPTKGREVGKYRPCFILSSKKYNKSTGLVICSPISSSIRGGITEVAIENLDKPSVVAASIIQTLAWKNRKAKFITKAESKVLPAVQARLLPLIGASV